MKDHFAWGPTIDIAQLTRAEAAAWFGEPVYEAWLHTLGQRHPSEPATGRLRVKRVDRQNRTITVEWEDE